MKASLVTLAPLAFFVSTFAGCSDTLFSNPAGLEQQSAVTSESLNFSELTPAVLAGVDVNVRELIDKGIADGWSGLDIIIIGDQPPIIRYNRTLPSGEVVHSPDLITGNPDPLPPGVREYQGILTPEQTVEARKDPGVFLRKLFETMEPGK